MLHYEEFEKMVLEETGSGGHSWRHLLPVIPTAHRHRFLITIGKGYRIPLAFDFVMNSQTIGEDAYEAFLKEALERKPPASKVAVGAAQRN